MLFLRNLIDNSGAMRMPSIMVFWCHSTNGTTQVNENVSAVPFRHNLSSTCSWIKFVYTSVRDLMWSLTLSACICAWRLTDLTIVAMWTLGHITKFRSNNLSIGSASRFQLSQLKLTHAVQPILSPIKDFSLCVSVIFYSITVHKAFTNINAHSLMSIFATSTICTLNRKLYCVNSPTENITPTLEVVFYHYCAISSL